MYIPRGEKFRREKNLNSLVRIVYLSRSPRLSEAHGDGLGKNDIPMVLFLFSSRSRTHHVFKHVNLCTYNVSIVVFATNFRLHCTHNGYNLNCQSRFLR